MLRKKWFAGTQTSRETQPRWSFYNFPKDDVHDDDGDYSDDSDDNDGTDDYGDEDDGSDDYENTPQVQPKGNKQRTSSSFDWDPYDPTYKKYLHIGDYHDIHD